MHRPDREIAASQSAKFLKDIESLAEEGDWIVTRGYHAGDVLVANATGMPISHTGIYDRELRQVIEADAGGVHATDWHSPLINKVGNLKVEMKMLQVILKL